MVAVVSVDTYPFLAFSATCAAFTVPPDSAVRTFPRSLGVICYNHEFSVSVTKITSRIVVS